MEYYSMYTLSYCSTLATYYYVQQRQQKSLVHTRCCINNTRRTFQLSLRAWTRHGGHGGRTERKCSLPRDRIPRRIRKESISKMLVDRRAHETVNTIACRACDKGMTFLKNASTAHAVRHGASTTEVTPGGVGVCRKGWARRGKSGTRGGRYGEVA